MQQQSFCKHQWKYHSHSGEHHLNEWYECTICGKEESPDVIKQLQNSCQHEWERKSFVMQHGDLHHYSCKFCAKNSRSIKKDATSDRRPPAIAKTAERTIPASERTESLPNFQSFDDLKKYLCTAFRPKEAPNPEAYGPFFWLTPEELCDLVDRYSNLFSVYYDEYSCPISEDMCCVRLFEKGTSSAGKIEFSGLYRFRDRGDMRDARGWSFLPELNQAIPRIANEQGRYRFNFYFEKDYAPEDPKPTEIPSSTLWEKLFLRKEELTTNCAQDEADGKKRMEEAIKREKEEKRLKLQEVRRESGDCIMCGRKMGFFQKIRGKDRHNECESFSDS